MSKVYKVVRVDWTDSSGNPRWTRIEDLAEPAGVECVTVGFIVKQNKTAIAIAQSLSNGGQCDHIMEIPRCVIRKITRWK